MTKSVMNQKSGKMELKITSKSGRKFIISYPTCPYLDCNFHDMKREIVLKHIEEFHS